MASTAIEERCIGLDPVSRSTMKFFIQDVVSLQPVQCSTLTETGMLGYRNHVVNRVEVMGIVVRVDKRDRRHSYAVDDGTGVIQCTLWKNRRTDSLPDLDPETLPLSLQTKLAELKTANEERYETGYSIGDLVLIRGGVKSFRNRLEIDVLDIRKIDNPCIEYQRVLRLPSFYKLYHEKIRFPSAIDKALKSAADGAFNQQSVTAAMARHIQEYQDRCDTWTESSENLITATDVLFWPSVSSLVQHQKISDDGPLASNKADNSEIRYITIIHEALEDLESGRGLLIRRRGLEPNANPTYEIITATCRLSRLVLFLLQKACSSSEKNSDKGCHILHIMEQLKHPSAWGQGWAEADKSSYIYVTEKVLSRSLACLEANSDIIDAGYGRYLPIQ